VHRPGHHYTPTPFRADAGGELDVPSFLRD
jgi:hypothetical protein